MFALSNCPQCQSERTVHRGARQSLFGVKERYQCLDCEKYFSIGTSSTPQILLLDIETLPMEVFVWGLKHNDYISPDNIIKDWSVACWAAKWLFGSKTYGKVVSSEEAVERQDSSILGEMWKLIDEADIIITQNGKQFDIKRLNTKFILNGYAPPMYYTHIDTLIVLRNRFAFSSNKLDYVNKMLGINQKKSMEMEDWRECTRGNKEYLDKMLRYCKRDVGIHEEMYLRIRPWIAGHANLNLYADHDQEICPACGKSDLKWEGKYSTQLGQWEAFRCQSCGAIGRASGKKNKINSTTIRN